MSVFRLKLHVFSRIIPLFLEHTLQHWMFLSLGRRARLLVAVAWVISAIFSVPILILYHETPIEGKKCSLSQLRCSFPRPTAGLPHDVE